LEQEELLSCKILVCKEAPGDERRFTGARFCVEHEQRMRRQSPGDLVQMRIKRQGGDFVRDHGIVKRVPSSSIGDIRFFIRFA
jgi:hypothetical protein